MGTMNASGWSLIWPLLVQVALTLAVLVVLGRLRFKALGSRDVRLGEVALSGEAWPERAKQAANNFTNQFETPVLFYVLIMVALHVGASGPLMTVLAWGYVASRIAHAVEHIGANNVRRRFAIFSAGVLILVAMLIGILVSAL